MPVTYKIQVSKALTGNDILSNIVGYCELNQYDPVTPYGVRDLSQ